MKQEILSTIPIEAETLSQEILNLEQTGLKELFSSTEFMNAKRGGREPGRHQWGR